MKYLSEQRPNLLLLNLKNRLQEDQRKAAEEASKKEQSMKSIKELQSVAASIITQLIG